VVLYECCDEAPGSAKGEEFLDKLRDYQFLKKKFALWS
jgi:hypothetical protein